MAGRPGRAYRAPPARPGAVPSAPDFPAPPCAPRPRRISRRARARGIPALFPPEPAMVVIDALETARRLSYPSLIEALRTAFRDGAAVPPRHHHTIPMAGGDPATLLLMPAWTHVGPLPPAAKGNDPAPAESS